jgi:hypothetical protein
VAVHVEAARVPARGVVNQGEEGVIGVDQLLELDVKLVPRGAPVGDPPPQAVEADVLRLIGRLVIVDHDRFRIVLPGLVAGRGEVLEAPPDEVDVRLGRRGTSIPSGWLAAGLDMQPNGCVI